MQWFYKLESSSIIEFQNRNFEIGNLLKMQRSMCFIQYIILLWWCVISKWNSNVLDMSRKRKKNNKKKIQRHVIMKSCCLWTYYLNIENKVTYSSPFSTCQNVIWTSSSNQMITIGTSMFSILSVVFKTGQTCTTKHSEM